MQKIPSKILLGSLILTQLLGLSACGSSEPGPLAPPQGESLEAQLEVWLQNGFAPLSSLAGVTAGTTVFLELRGAPAGAEVSWSSSDESLARFAGPGQLELLQAGQLRLTVQVEAQTLSLPATISAAAAEGEIPPPEEPDPQEPKPQPKPFPHPNFPLKDKGNQPPPEPPAPPPVASDAFIDEIVDWQAGTGPAQGMESFIFGPPQGGGLSAGGTHTLSLGRGGVITLKSDTAILNGTGMDFIVFENAFYAGGNPANVFAELGEVSVSQDGVKFFTFPCDTASFAGCAGAHPVLANSQTNKIDPTDPKTAGGDAFDLNQLGLDWALYLRIEDVSGHGCGNLCSNGFDLDAIAIRYQ